MMERRELSLVAKFDDICRGFSNFESCDQEFLKFAKNQEECRQKWLAAENECVRLQAVLKDANQFSSQLEAKIRHISALLMHEVKIRHQLQLEHAQMAKQLSMVKEIVTTEKGLRPETREKLVQLGSTESINRFQIDGNANMELVLSDLVPERSEDELELSEIRSARAARNKRATEDWHNHNKLEASKRQKFISGNEIEPRGDFRTQSDCVTIPRAIPLTFKHKEKPPRPPPPLALQPPPRPIQNQHSGMHLMPRIDSIDDDLEDPRTEFKTNKKQHNFLKKTIIKPENCLPCGSRVKFGRSALKCSDCRATCHQECKLLMPLPCVPYVAVPLSVDEDTRRTIGEFAPHLSPMIPALVVHCVNQLDERGLDSVGLYAVGGSERKVQELKESLIRDKWHPHIADLDVHVIASTLKIFLHELKEPIIPTSLRELFLAVVPLTDERDVQSVVYSLVPQLPQPNRDTLAFLILHLQRVARSDGCKMPTSRLAQVFGPIMLGQVEDDDSDLLDQEWQTSDVMEKLLEIPRSYWTRFVDVEVGIDCKKDPLGSKFFPMPSLE